MIRILVALFFATAVSAQNVRITVVPPAALEPSQLAKWRLTFENVSGRDLPSVPVTLQFGSGVLESLAPPLDCAPGLGGQVCTLPSIAAGATFTLEASVQHPFRYGRVTASAGLSYATGVTDHGHVDAAFWREFPVTTTADAGPGSLRQTILDINADQECRYRADAVATPCKAAFRIDEPLPAEGWYTIRPLSPLPALTAFDAAIDGTTQTATNALGPAVALDGSALQVGNGITADGVATFEGAFVIGMCEIRGLAIGGFPWNGIFATTRSRLTVEECYIGVDPTGRRAHPNGARGIASTLMRGTIARNVIGGNARSGVFYLGSVGDGPSIRDNRIGVAAHDDTPIGNGASGIFIGDFRGSSVSAEIEGNVIANNAHFGIALTPNAPMLVLANTVRDNGGGGIDVGLDGPTESGAAVAPPVIVSAVYANGVTTIKGFAGAGTRRQVLLYANRVLEPGGFAEGEQFLGMTAPQFHGDTAFTFEYAGDLRGRYINGTVVAAIPTLLETFSWGSSEFGRAIAVAD